MTGTPTVVASPWWRRSGIAMVVTALAAAAFIVVSPGPIDLWAARARASAAQHGVGLHYWFAWFSGMVPGNYSVLLPWIYRVLPPTLLGAISTVAAVVLTRILAAGSVRPTAATWLAAMVLSASLWAGRVPFAVGTALMIVSWIGVRHRWHTVAIGAGVLAALVTPVSGVFTALCLLGVFLHDRERRWHAVACAAVVVTVLAVVGLYFGMPGTQGYGSVRAILTMLALALLLAATPPHTCGRCSSRP